MAKAARARGATPLLAGLPEDIVFWEILVRLPPKSLLRCRPVCRAWRRVTSTREFLLAHHGRQPSLPVVCGYECAGGHYQDIFAFDHQTTDAQLQPVARLDDTVSLEASCDGLLIISTYGMGGKCFSVCNPATRQHAPLRLPSGFSLFSVLGMYLHRRTGEYRLLLYRRSHKRWMHSDLLSSGQAGCYVYVLGSDQPPRFIGGPEAASACFNAPALVRDNLHWYPVHDESEDNPLQTESKPVIVFDTVAESFRQMHAPVFPANSYIFEMDGTLGMYTCNSATEIIDIWVLQNYECEVWEYKYRVELPVVEIRGQYRGREDDWYVRVVSVDGDAPLLLSHGQGMFYVDTDGELVDSFYCDGQQLHPSHLWLKQTLVSHNFFTAPEGYAVHILPFI